MKNISSGSAAFFLFLVMASCPVMAQKKEGNPFDQLKSIKGPAKAELSKWASIDVPEGFAFLKAEETRIIMAALDNSCSGLEVGSLWTTNFFSGPAQSSPSWFVIFEFEECGYVKDDEKKDLQAEADKLLQNYKDGAAKHNIERRKKNEPCMTIVGWDIPPRYNETTHNLEWCIRGKDDAGNVVINHNTRVLGRHGVMKAVLVAHPSRLSEIMPEYDKKIAGMDYKSGEKYAEYRKGDKIAKYGLVALVAGGAAAAAIKTGLLQKLMKPILIGLIAVAAFFKKIFGRFFGK